MFAYICSGWVGHSKCLHKQNLYVLGKKAKFKSRIYSKILNYATFDKRPNHVKIV